MTQKRFSLFSTQVQLAQNYWKQHLSPKDHILDLTCGNGHDTLFLAKIIQNDPKGSITAYDIQEKAIRSCKKKISETLGQQILSQISFQVKCHSDLSSLKKFTNINLIVYNLGYLPGADKHLTTQTSTTLESLKAACKIIQPGGAISIMCYPGHEEGALEEHAILSWAGKLNCHEWHCCYHKQINGNKAPSLLWVQKAKLN